MNHQAGDSTSASHSEEYLSYLNSELLRPVVEQFIKGLPTRVAALRMARDRGDYLGIAQQAHQLKGTSGSIGFMRISDATAALEEKAKAKEKNPTDLDPFLTRLEELCYEAIHIVEKHGKASVVGEQGVAM